MTNTRKKTKLVSLKIVGLILSESYQRSRIFAERLHKHHKRKFLPPSIIGMLEMDWIECIQKLQKEKGGKTWALKASVVIFLNESILGGEEELFNYFRDYLYQNPDPEELKTFAEREYTEYLNRGNLIYTYMELSLDGEYMGTLLFQLRYDLLPKSCLLFTEFCIYKKHCYTGKNINRVCKRGWFQGGGMKGELTRRYLEDENYSYKHDRRGILSFVNEGKHTNMHQFMVTFGAAEWMDGKYVAFGRVVEGADVLRRIEQTPCTYEKPDREIKITNCGITNFGLGSAIDPQLKLKGITVGEPHLHFEFFEELLFEKFEHALLNRLDEDEKRLIEEQWVLEIIWDRVMKEMKKRCFPLFDDVLDEGDQSSKVYLLERYLAGLYSLADIPDLFIKSLLDGVIEKALDKSDVILLVKSVVNMLIDSATVQDTTEEFVEGIVDFLVKKSLKIIFGSDSIECSRVSASSIGNMKVLSEASGLQKSLTNFKKRVGLEEVKISKSQLSNKESLAAYVWGMLLELLNDTNIGN